MKAADFLAQRGKPAPSHPLKFRILGIARNEEKISADAEAVFCLVNEEERLESERAADKAIAADYKDGQVSERVRAAERSYLFLFRALRDADRPAEPFCDSVLELKTLLVSDVALRLEREYQAFIETSFPEVIPQAEFANMVEDAKAHFFGDLLTSYGYWPIRRVLPSLAEAFGASLQPT